MLKHRLFWTAALALALCAVPTRASAKPQTASPRGDAAVTAVTPDASPTGTRTGAARTKARKEKREVPPCLKPAVQLSRQRGDEIEQRELSLTFCDGKLNPAALDSLSVLARSREVERPALSDIRAYQRLSIDKGPLSKRRDPAYLTHDVMRLHPGLVERLQKVAERFPGRVLEVVSGHRPEARETSRHHHGRALDFRVQGIARERLRDFLRSFEETGVGYYPNSIFVHMDVRDDKGYWVDRSGPGERADYGVWPPPAREIAQTQASILQGALADLATLGSPDLSGSRPITVARSTAQAQRDVPKPRARAAEPEESGDSMSAAEVVRIRRDALKALEVLR